MHLSLWIKSLTNNFYSCEDESALRAKVEEAMNVYDEYVKTKGGEGEDGDAKEGEKTEEKA